MNFKKEILKLVRFEKDKEIINEIEETQVVCKALNNTITRFDKNQKEISMKMEDISETLEDYNQYEVIDEKLKEAQNEKDALVKSLLELSDLIEDFYCFSLENMDKKLSDQATIMWNTALKNLNLCGVSRINDEYTAFNPFLNTVISTSWEQDMQENIILKTLKSGYIYNNSIIRKSTVIVNKKGEI